jgi:hypothetical protein
MLNEYYPYRAGQHEEPLTHRNGRYSFNIPTISTQHPNRYVINMPWAFDAMWRVVRRWMDPETKAKVNIFKNTKDALVSTEPRVICICGHCWQEGVADVGCRVWPM